MESLTQITATISGFLWSLPAALLLVGTGIFLTFILKGIQFRGFIEGIKVTFGKYSNKKDRGETTPFQALCATLSATVGTGNIAGVATAVALGGPGALFWMWITAIFGMATKYATSSLSIRYREKQANGEFAGGPMYVLKNALNLKWLGSIYAFFTIIASFGVGNAIQANSITNAMDFSFPALSNHNLMIGIILAVLVGTVILGGIRSIATTAAFIVPFMAIIYIIIALVIIFSHFNQIPHAFYIIFHSAFNHSAIFGGGLGIAIRYGVARGVFSNEAGLGTAGIMHATAKNSIPARQGLVAMLGPFIDTILICSMTGLVIVITGVFHGNTAGGPQGAALTSSAFAQGLGAIDIGFIGKYVVGISLLFFAYTTIISWSYYGDRCVLFLWGKRATLPYKMIYVSMTIVGATFPLQLIWNIGDIMNILMAAPNLIALLLLAKPLMIQNRLDADIISGKVNPKIN